MPKKSATKKSAKTNNKNTTSTAEIISTAALKSEISQTIASALSSQQKALERNTKALEKAQASSSKIKDKITKARTKKAEISAKHSIKKTKTTTNQLEKINTTLIDLKEQSQASKIITQELTIIKSTLKSDIKECSLLQKYLGKFEKSISTKAKTKKKSRPAKSQAQTIVIQANSKSDASSSTTEKSASLSSKAQSLEVI